MAKIPGHDYDQMLTPLGNLDWNAAHDLKTQLEGMRLPKANGLIDTPADNVPRRDELKDELVRIRHAQARVNAHIAGLAAKGSVELSL